MQSHNLEAAIITRFCTHISIQVLITNGTIFSCGLIHVWCADEYFHHQGVVGGNDSSGCVHCNKATCHTVKQ